jgi:hypothetical protein
VPAALCNNNYCLGSKVEVVFSNSFNLLGAAANTTTLGTGDTSQITVSEKATGAAFASTFGTDLSVEVGTILFFVSFGSTLAASYSSSHKGILPDINYAYFGLIHAAGQSTPPAGYPLEAKRFFTSMLLA